MPTTVCGVCVCVCVCVCVGGGGGDAARQFQLCVCVCVSQKNTNKQNTTLWCACQWLPTAIDFRVVWVCVRALRTCSMTS